MAVAIKVEKGCTGIPMLFWLQQAGPTRDIGKSSIPVVAVEHVPSKVSHKQVKMPVIVVVTNADTLAPAMTHQARSFRDIGEGAIMIISVKAIRWFLPFGELTESPTVDQENIQPSIVVVIEKSNSTSRRGQKEIFGFMSDESG